MPLISTLLLSFVGIFTGIGCFVADFNHTHIYNPRWPGHAKFHAGQTMSLGLTLGLLTLFILHRPIKDSKDTQLLRRERLQYASLVASLYWITQGTALLYPNTLAVDTEFGEGAPQLYLSAGLLIIIGVAYKLGLAEIDGVKGKAQ